MRSAQATGRFDGKVIALIGAATGIGAETARQLAAVGATVVIGDINSVDAEAVASSIRLSGGSAAARTADLAEDDSIACLVRWTVGEFGRLDGLHLNGADLFPGTIGKDSNVVDIDLEVWERTLRVDLRGYLLGMRHAIPAMLAGGGGAIVCTSSANAFLGTPDRPAYSVAKAGINALVRHAASRWGKQGIRVNAVCPGPILTPERMAPERRAELDAYVADRLPKVLAPRLGTAEDVAYLVRFLLSSESEFINGQVISVDGGYTMR